MEFVNMLFVQILILPMFGRENNYAISNNKGNV